MRKIRIKVLKEVLISGKQSIKLYNETEYCFETKSNLKQYEKSFISGNKSILTSLIGIEILEKNKLISSCLISSEGGGTRIHKNSVLVKNDKLIVCCANTIFKLNISSLDLEWKTISDLSTCFAIYSINQGYIVHGELEISRLDENGKILWQNRGRDIWTTAEGINDFEIYYDFILATDWEYYQYKFDFDDNLLEEVKPNQNKKLKTLIQELKNKNDLSYKYFEKLRLDLKKL